MLNSSNIFHCVSLLLFWSDRFLFTGRKKQRKKKVGTNFQGDQVSPIMSLIVNRNFYNLTRKQFKCLSFLIFMTKQALETDNIEVKFFIVKLPSSKRRKQEVDSRVQPILESIFVDSNFDNCKNDQPCHKELQISYVQKSNF